MAANFRMEANPFASDFCTQPPSNLGPPAFHTCHPDPGRERTTDPFKGVAGDPTTQRGPQDYGTTRALDRWGFGMILLPYLLDWGDCVKQIDRQKAEVTTLRAFAHSEDRRLAMRHLDRFTWPRDDETTPMEMWLLQHPEHVGFRWHPIPLKRWYDFATTGTDAALPPEGIGATAAIAAANTWIARVQPLWLELTTEPFPYDSASMAGFWEPSLNGTPLSDLAPDPA